LSPMCTRPSAASAWGSRRVTSAIDSARSCTHARVDASVSV
jgi:hypothetical protein